MDAWTWGLNGNKATDADNDNEGPRSRGWELREVQVMIAEGATKTIIDIEFYTLHEIVQDRVVSAFKVECNVSKERVETLLFKLKGDVFVDNIQR